MKKTEQQKKTLVILDAHAIIHRAYHALPNFADSAGKPTGALYGLASMLLRIIETLKPDALVAAYDLPKPTFRHHAYEAYKGGRAKIDDDLVSQLKISRHIFEAFGIPVLDAEGFEADDVIGTLVEQFKDADLSIVIASGDMDTLQLVDGDRVRVFTLKKGVTDTVVYDEAGVRERFGFAPAQLVDYKGLRGDQSDNIVGVPGIGEKTATAIIGAFGTIEGLYTALKKGDPRLKSEAHLTDRIITILTEHEEDAFFSKTLATIRRDAPIRFALPEGSYRDTLDVERLLQTLADYEFRSLLPRVKKLFHVEEIPAPEASDPGLLKRASIALWVLYSEEGTPTLENILARTRKKTLQEAYDSIIVELKKRDLFKVYEEIEVPIIPIVEEMERYGIGIDRAHFEKLRERMKEDLARIEGAVAVYSETPINLASPKQLSEFLFGKLSLKPKGKAKASGAYTTNAEALAELTDAHPAVPLILEHREVQKLLGTYVEPLLAQADAQDRVHATFLQHGTTTGRFSSTNPNLQNIPAKGESGREIRHGFVAAPGYVFVGCDYSQIELRVLAMLSGDEALRAAFERGDDIHATVASFMFQVPPEAVTNDMRRKAKVINFGILYGMGVTALQKNLGTSRAEAQAFYARYFESFPRIAEYVEATKASAREKGYTETMFGRRRYLPAINATAPYLRAFAERVAVNAPIQGANADIVKIAIKLVDEDLRAASLHDAAHLVLQIHDELVYEVRESSAEAVKGIIVRAMEGVFARAPYPAAESPIPLAVSSGAGRRLDELK